MTDNLTSKDRVPGPRQPPRLHGDGCICGDFARHDCPVKDRTPATSNFPCKHLMQPPQGVTVTCEIGPFICPWCQIERLQRELQELRLQYVADFGQEQERTPSEPSVWQPIETAPKDGLWFLSFIAGAIQDYSMCRWFGDSNGWLDDAEFPIAPTHWMPLPTPPGKEGGQ